MCVKVFLADDAEVMRRAIRTLLSSREDIAVVGEASNLCETIEKATELHPDLIILDAHLAEGNHAAPTEVKNFLNGARVLAISFGTDEQTEELADIVGAARLLDKMELFKELIPAILELAPAGSRPS
jgi:DNA-binding NarL/FixJ family response regulator